MVGRADLAVDNAQRIAKFVRYQCPKTHVLAEQLGFRAQSEIELLSAFLHSAFKALLGQSCTLK